MMDETRRNILKMFGVGATAAAASAIPTPALDATQTATQQTATHIPPARQNPLTLPFKVPDGMTYNWKRVFVDGRMADFRNIAEMVMAGWQPVPSARHHELFANDGSYWIEHGGLVLMEKPTADCAKPFAHPMLVLKPLLPLPNDV